MIELLVGVQAIIAIGYLANQWLRSRQAKQVKGLKREKKTLSKTINSVREELEAAQSIKLLRTDEGTLERMSGDLTYIAGVMEGEEEQDDLHTMLEYVFEEMVGSEEEITMRDMLSSVDTQLAQMRVVKNPLDGDYFTELAKNIVGLRKEVDTACNRAQHITTTMVDFRNKEHEKLDNIAGELDELQKRSAEFLDNACVSRISHHNIQNEKLNELLSNFDNNQMDYLTMKVEDIFSRVTALESGELREFLEKDLAEAGRMRQNLNDRQLGISDDLRTLRMTLSNARDSQARMTQRLERMERIQTLTLAMLLTQHNGVAYSGDGAVAAVKEFEKDDRYIKVRDALFVGDDDA